MAQASKIPLSMTMDLVPLRCTPEVEVYDVHYDSLDGIRIAGWYCLPRDRPDKLPAIVQMPGYKSDPAIPRRAAQQGYAAFSAAPRGKIFCCHEMRSIVNASVSEVAVRAAG